MKIKELSLAAMVRDEVGNPAGGIVKCLNSVLPFVEKAVVVDTGSIDGTLSALRRMAGRYAHLEVYQRPFDDFAKSRNYTLSKVRTKLALVLDADELLMPSEYDSLRKFIPANPAKAYDFVFKEIYACGTVCDTQMDVQITRVLCKSLIFSNSINGYYEDALTDGICSVQVPKSVATIKHFLSHFDAVEKKRLLWYGHEEFKSIKPLVHANQYGWKEMNPGRQFFDNPSPQTILHFPRLFD